ncbi:hypothetical protein [Paracoccus fontiphilus]|nr:hypothetical protein [Paracoccus fontiphilus]
MLSKDAETVDFSSSEGIETNSGAQQRDLLNAEGFVEQVGDGVI